MDILNADVVAVAAVAAATNVANKNLALKELIDSRTKPVQNMMLQLAV